MVNMIRQRDGHFSVVFLIEPFKLWGVCEVQERMVSMGGDVLRGNGKKLKWCSIRPAT